jgi:hypothetical protein
VSRKRIVIVSLTAGVLAGAGMAGGIAEASGGHGSGSPSSSGPAHAATVARTNLASTVQVGGSIGYQNTYTVAAPSGATPQQLAQDQQAVTQAQQGLSADQATESDAAGADLQAVTAAEGSANTAAATLAADEAKEASDCAGKGASTPACSQDTQKVSQDQQAVTQAQQQLATANDTSVRDHDQNQAKVAADSTQLQAAQANLAQLETTAANPGTTYTELPQVGQIIREDQAVYGVSNEAVPLLYGSVAPYRAFGVGMSAGADVGELTHDLIALGYGAGLTQSDSYTSATAVAVERWQTALGLPATGQILLGEVVFEPGPIRVTTVTPSVGQALGGGGGSGSSGGGGGTVLTATSTTPVVTVALDVTDEYLVKPGDAVTVVLPDGTSTVGGRVETVGDVATCPGGGGSGSGSGVADESPCSSSGSGSNSTPTVTVTVALDSTPPGATLDQAPVNVNITSQTADGVLAVPVNALLALQGGGYGVEVVDGTTTRLVGVTTGLYSNTLVQIRGVGITAGTKVEVPSS